MDNVEKIIEDLETARALVWDGKHCNITDDDDALTVSYAINGAVKLIRRISKEKAND